ncbi:MAG: Hpt domain-containing protein, partial [Nitrospirota bacterium]|nr:Hpt domain-containing protein [Nitrospirota bacterium]
MAFDVKKFIARFVEEARDHIEALNRGLVELEKNPGDEENINAIFRAAHTIKGSSRMLKLTAITEVAHKLEDALGELREKRIAHTRELAGLLFRGVDAVSAMIEMVSAG